MWKRECEGREGDVGLGLNVVREEQDSGGQDDVRCVPLRIWHMV